MRRLLGLFLAGLLSAGCVTPIEGGDVISQTAARLDEIRSGVLSMSGKLVVVGERGRETIGFTLEGPFSLPEDDDRLPVADLQLTRTAEGREQSIGLVSTGSRAFVELAGRVYELPPGRVPRLQGRDGPRALRWLEVLRIEGWFEESELSYERTPDGQRVARVRGDVSVVNTVNDMLRIARQLGFAAAPRQRLKESSGKQLDAVVTSSDAELLTGGRDRLLRRVSLGMEFDGRLPEELDRLLRGLVPVGGELDVRITHHNEPVDVRAPPRSVPFSRLRA